MTRPRAHAPLPLPDARGFTLMETLAAVLMTSLVVTFAMSAYVQVADTAEQATLRLRDDLHATTILDRMADDLQSAVLLVKPDEVDPLRHPWYFVSESQSAFGGSDGVRFIGRRQRAYLDDEHSSDFAQIAYRIETDDEGLQTLYRQLAPGLPAEFEPAFPPIDDERSHVLGEGLSGFTLRFSNGDGEWVDAWDSTQLTQSSLLPISVEISFDMGSPGEASDEYGPRFQRRVVMPMMPLALDAMIASAQEEFASGGASTDDDDDDELDDGSLLACIQQRCLEELSGDICAQANNQWGSLTDDVKASIAGQAGCR